MSDDYIPKLGDIVYYIDEDRAPVAAIIAYVDQEPSAYCKRPVCNLTIFNHDGRTHARRRVEPAYHDGFRWMLLNKWAKIGEIDESELREPICDAGKLTFTSHQPITK